MDQQAAFDKFKQCTIEVLQVDPDKVQPDARFGDDRTLTASTSSSW